MYTIDTDGSITLPRGDTLLFSVRMKQDGEIAHFPEGAVGVFGVSKGKRTLLSKVFPVEEGCMAVCLTNADTRSLKAGEYSWDLRIVTDPEYDGDGNVKCDDASDQVVSIFSGAFGMRPFTLTEVAVNV